MAEDTKQNARRTGENVEKKKTRSYKHVQLERKRPQLTRGEGELSAGKSGKRPSASRTGSAGKDPKAKLKVIPLGGLDAIGKNMTVFECKGDMIVDDAGLMFPDDDHPGIDLILPDYTYVLENADKLRGIVITHMKTILARSRTYSKTLTAKSRSTLRSSRLASSRASLRSIA